MKTVLGTLLVASALSMGTVAVVVYSGLIDVGADEPHSAAVHAFLEAARDRSVATRADDIAVPDLADEEKVRAGSGNYAAMCSSCHLSPGQSATELSRGLYPPPPNFTQSGVQIDPASAFWVIKHGIKSTGMPAWGTSMEDRYIWEMVAFLQKLPSLDASQYRSLVASSGGHQHGGGESEAPGHGTHHDEAAPAVDATEQSATGHTHADGKVHQH